MGTVSRLLLITAAAMLPAGYAAAQTMPWPGDPPRGGAPAPWPGAGGAAAPPPSMMSPMGPPRSPMGGPPGGGAPPCMAEFAKLREEVERRGKAAKAASQRKVGREEMCKFITSFAEAEAKWIKYVDTNTQACGIPAQVASQLKQVHANTEQAKQRICTAGPGPGSGPSLHDALDTSRTTPDGAKAGSTFNTLTGPVIR